MYGYLPSVYGIPQQQTLGNDVVDAFIKNGISTFDLIKDNLAQVQSRMNFFGDKHCSERTFEVADLVYLCLQPYLQYSLALRRNMKLAPRFYGLYPILTRVGKVAYQLDFI